MILARGLLDRRRAVFVLVVILIEVVVVTIEGKVAVEVVIIEFRVEVVAVEFRIEVVVVEIIDVLNLLFVVVRKIFVSH